RGLCLSSAVKSDSQSSSSSILVSAYQLQGLMRQGHCIEDRLPSGFANSCPQFGVSQQDLQTLHEFLQTIDRNQPSVSAVTNDLVDALSPACDCRFATRHRFQINTPESFIAA